MTHPPMAKFLSACGAEGPLSFTVDRNDEKVLGRWSLPQPFAVVGRDPRLELTLDDESVSRRHAFLITLGGRVFCLDLGSRHGLTWDGVAMPSGWLDPHGSIGIGAYRLKLISGVRGAEPSPPPLVNPLAIDGPTSGGSSLSVALESPHKVTGARRLRVRQELTLIGRAPECRLQIRDDSISRYHAVLVRLSTGLWVVDLASRDGLRVNGARVRWSELVDGDHLHIGRYRLRVLVGESAARDPQGGTNADSGSAENLIPLLPPDQFPAILTGAGVPAAGRDPTVGIQSILEGHSPDQVAIAEALLQPLVQQFGQMQQQMFDQFHETMLSMFQMFGSLHRDQIGLVRAELDRIRLLGDELKSLQTQKDQPVPRPSDENRLARPAETKLGSTRGAASVPSVPDSHEGRSGRSPHDQVARRESPRAGEPQRPRRDFGQRTDAPTTTTSPPASNFTNPSDPHRQITMRIQELQAERQNRWQRLLSLVGAGGSGGS